MSSSPAEKRESFGGLREGFLLSEGVAVDGPSQPEGHAILSFNAGIAGGALNQSPSRRVGDRGSPGGTATNVQARWLGGDLQHAPA
jgi:hypothetical protein